MVFDSPQEFLSSRTLTSLPRGVLTVVFAEDDWMLRATLDHAARHSPVHILVIGDVDAVGEGSAGEGSDISFVRARLSGREDRVRLLNRLIAAQDGRWIHWLETGEFFFFPWCETRTINDIATFLKDERRPALYTYALDLYAPNLPRDGDDLTSADLWFDTKGYHAFPREDLRLALFGSLGWRYEEFLPASLQSIGRPALFRAAKGVLMARDLTFEDVEYQSVSAPWHHSPTGALMTLRRARLLLANGDFAAIADTLLWSGSEKFTWNSAQLLDHGMIEPGQWF